MIKKYFKIYIIFWIPISTLAQIPSGYHDSISNQSGDSLKSALHNIIKDHIEYAYSAKSTDVWDNLKLADRDPVDSLERVRNDIIYTYQRNRNLFIDYPEWVGLIWGNDQ